jgi:hypothetical protein
VKETDLVTQLIRDRYLDLTKLKTFLNSNFPGRWKVQIRMNQYTIATPRLLTEVILPYQPSIKVHRLTQPQEELGELSF